MAVLLIHGIFDTAARMAPLAAGLVARGIPAVQAMALPTEKGRASIPALAALVGRTADALAASAGVERIDLVGFSMGALVARYYVQRAGGKERVRRLISLSGPHQGTLTAYALPFAGVREMRPGSALLRDLAADADPFGPVQVHCLYTPFDLMILPASSSRLPGARSLRRVPVAFHRSMLTDARVINHVAGLLA